MPQLLNRMMWARIRRRVNILVEHGMRPVEVLEILDRAIADQEKKLLNDKEK